MTHYAPAPFISRRAILSTGAALVCVRIAAPSGAALADPEAPGVERTPHFIEDYQKLLAGREAIEGGIDVELPEIAENGNFVPITIHAESPMMADDHVTAIHLLSSGNPVARVATFRLSPLNAVARVQSRMRLARTQDVVAIAEHSTGALRVATTLVKVTIGGCAS
ncbi:MAG: thiosulfate oxidation carrier protein SoxY [Hyphomicrobium sp.]